MKHKSFLLLTIVLLITTLCFSGCQEQTNQNGNHTNTTTENTFLGDWETKDGSWVDPMQLDEMLDPNLAQKDSQGIKDLKDKKETEERKDD